MFVVLDASSQAIMLVLSDRAPKGCDIACLAKWLFLPSLSSALFKVLWVSCTQAIVQSTWTVVLGQGLALGHSLLLVPLLCSRDHPCAELSRELTFSIAAHGPKSGSDFPSHSSDHSCHQECVHSFFLDREPPGFHPKVDVGDRGAERLPETSVGIKGPALEFWNSGIQRALL